MDEPVVVPLAPGPPALELPTDRSRPALVSYRGGRAEFLVNSEVTERLRDLSQREGATLFMTLVAAFEPGVVHSRRIEDEISVGRVQ